MNFHPIVAEDFAGIEASIPDTCKAFNDTRVMITGAGGLIGAYLAEFFVWLNQERGMSIFVTCLDNWSSGKPERLAKIDEAIDLIQHDISEPFGPPFAAHWRADYVFNAASIAAPKFYLQMPLETIRTHVAGSMRVCEHAAATNARLIHLSSVEVYGEPSITPTPESYAGSVDPLLERSCYSESKRMSETICATWHRKHALNVSIARPFNCFGPGERLDNGRVVPNIIKATLDRELFTIRGDGRHTRSFCYLSDAIIQLLSLAVKGQPGEVYNIGDGESEVSLIDLAKTASAALGVGWQYDNHESPNEPSRRRPDTTKILAIAPAPVVDLQSGLRRTYEYYK